MNILIVFTGDHQQYQVPRRVRCPNRGGDQVHAEPAAHGGAGQLREGRQKSLRLPVNRRPDREVRGAPLRGLPELPVPGGHRQRQHPRDKVLTQSLGSPLTEVFRYMKICKNSPDGKQQCPDQDRYPWLTDTCGGNEPCADCVL